MPARIEVYTRPLCLFCHQVLELLNRARVVYQRIDVADRQEQDKLAARYHAPAFPIVLVDGGYVGGYAHVLHLHSQGRLDQLSGPEGPPPSNRPAPSATSTPPASQISRQPAPSLMSAMSRLSKSLKEEPDKS